MIEEESNLTSKVMEKGCQPGCVLAICLLFGVFGVGMFLTETVRPALQILLAQSWKEIPCVIESSQVGVNGQGEDEFDSINIAYRYTYEGQEYRSKRYGFTPDSRTAPTRGLAVVDRYPPGKQTICFVNPGTPAEAVLNRGWHPEMGAGIIALYFAVLLGAVFFFVRRAAAIWHAKEEAKAQGKTLSGQMAVDEERMNRFGQILVFPLLWNSLVLVAGYAFFFVGESEEVPWWVKILVGAMAFFGFNLLREAVRKYRSAGGKSGK